jgi:hypothetical protein
VYVVVALPVELHAVPTLPLHVPVPGWQTTQPKPGAQVSAGVSAAQFDVDSVPPLQICATLPWQVTPFGEHAEPASPSVVASGPPLPLPLVVVSGPKNESGNAMSSVASAPPPPLLVLLLPVVASSPPLSAGEPLDVPLPLALEPPLLVLALPLDESPLDPESPRSNEPPLPELPHPTAIAAPHEAKDTQRRHLRVLPRCR